MKTFDEFLNEELTKDQLIDKIKVIKSNKDQLIDKIKVLKSNMENHPLKDTGNIKKDHEELIQKLETQLKSMKN